ncbi:uncharacterized protein LOC111692869 [Anoplophora glabripennis]|uniref:uncharacterized protein LOC111692869 n=1 Tax=Anoplophora glabripennis TaxID=217634 RepID=UPI000C78FC1D|nr:uncharacterized protein LOC111692869 [Anoplophora glabripennis]
MLQKYKKDVDNLRNSAKDLGLSNKELDIIFKKCFSDLKKSTNGSKQTKTKAQQLFRTVINIFLLFTLITIFIYILLNVHQPTSSIVLRNVQGLTYPTLKIVRFLSVPIIKMFPSLTDLYDETCLLENPYFYVADMECWPCEGVHAVLDLSEVDQSSFSSGSGTPFIVKIDLQPVTFKTLQHMYNENQEVFNVEARRIKSTNSSIHNLKDLFHSDMAHLANTTTHTSWRINKMVPARLIRKLFPRPSFISDRCGQSVERFIIIDGAKAEPYILPNTECSYIFVIQGSGERTIVLRPSMECSQNCRTVSVILKPSYVLWYNWWYWRPISLPTENSTGPSVSYINSYC